TWDGWLRSRRRSIGGARHSAGRRGSAPERGANDRLVPPATIGRSGAWRSCSMASPFPGMDPYLEGELWQEFHETLASAVRAQLMPRLAPKYVALLAKRYTLDRPALGVFNAPPLRVVYPDVHVVAPASASGAPTPSTMPAP